jgi:hypothetical protein
MNKLRYRKLTEASGRMQAEMLESYLEAHGIEVELVQEAYMQAWYAGASMHSVQILVPSGQFMQARELLKAFNQQ